MRTNGAFMDFAVPSPGGPQGGQAKVITAGADSNLWFTEPGVHKIARITRAGVVTEFTPPTALSGPMYIAGGPGGMIWFSEAANKIGVASSGFDITAPTVSITSPTQGAQLTVGQQVPAEYTCSDENRGSGITSCTGSVARHDAVDTSRPGPASLTVTGQDLAGNTTTSTRNFTVNPAPTPVPTATPVATQPPSATPVATPSATPTPVATVKPKARKPQKVHADLTWLFKFKGPYTWFTRLRVTGLTKGAKVTISCRGGGCPKGRATLSNLLRKKLRKGAVLEFRITKRGMRGAVLDLVIRKAGRPPVLRHRS
jgi:hypothetical protein